MDKSQTECNCNHFTHFAVLMQFDTASGPEYEISEVGSNVTLADTWHIVTYSENFGNRRLMKYFSQCNTCKVIHLFFYPLKTDEKALEIITYLGLTLSLLGITLTIISYVSLT